MTLKISTLPLLLFFLSLLSSTTSSSSLGNNKLPKNRVQSLRKPCKSMVFYFHDIIYNGNNSENATSAIVGEPAWADKTILTRQNHFGDLVVFDDPVTLNNNYQSTPVGRAQGFYMYDTKETFTSWLGFSFVFNSSEHEGSLSFAGANPSLHKTRDISVIGGTGDFLMARGVATLMTDAVEGDTYFRLRVAVKLYECWSSML